jgi:hypothetical protein
MSKKEPKGLPKKEHWERTYNPRIPNNQENQVMGSCFNPVKSKDRYKVYKPVNETDT